jgi:hypothetical protein
MRSMPQSPRRHRDRDRSRRVAAAVRAAGGSAMDAALAEIGAAFGEAAVVNGLKLRVERYLRLGPSHPACRARFGARAALLGGRSLDAATATVERWWRDERKAFQIASALGGATRLPLDVLSELRVILRLMRFKRMAAEYAQAVAALGGRPTAMAAE